MIGCGIGEATVIRLVLLWTANDGERVIVLTASNEVGKDEKNEFRIGPMTLGHKNLTDKEKKHLGLSARVRKSPSLDEDEENVTAINLPKHYNNNSINAEEKKDDTSVESTKQSGSYPQDGLASF